MFPRGAGGGAAAAAAAAGNGLDAAAAAEEYEYDYDGGGAKRQRVGGGGGVGAAAAAAAAAGGGGGGAAAAGGGLLFGGSSSSYYPPSAAAVALLNSYLPSSSSSLHSSISSYYQGSSPSLSSSLSPFLPPSPPPAATTLPPSLTSYLPSSPASLEPHFDAYISASFRSSVFEGPGHSPASFFGQPRSFPAVRLRGLPFNCTENDVYEFFAGLDVVDVLLTHKQGRFSGEAFCLFGAPMQVEFALQRNRQNMGQRYIEVFRCKKQEYYSAVAAEIAESGKPIPESASSLPRPKPAPQREQQDHTGVLKLRGLPFSASKRDIIEFFKGYDLSDRSIHFVVHSDGRATGESYVEFDGPSQSKEAMCRNKMMLGSRYVELFPSSREEAARARMKK